MPGVDSPSSGNATIRKPARWFLFLLASFLLLATGHTEQNFDFPGYVVSLPVYQNNQELLAQVFNENENQFLNLIRLRLRPLWHLWSGARLSLEYEADMLYTSSRSLFFTPTDKKPRQTVDLQWMPLNRSQVKLIHYIDRLYLRQNWSWGLLIAGRQRISWGTGRIWNPTDLFNPINPASFDKVEKDGADAVSLKYFLGGFTDLQLVYNVEDNWHTQNIAGRFRSNYRTVDFSLMIGRVERRMVLGADFAGNLFNGGIRGEALFSAVGNTTADPYFKYILGWDMQLNPKLYTLLEYHFNGQGSSRKENYNLSGVLEGKILNVARHYLFLQATYQIHPLVILGAMNNFNFDDGSGFAGITATVSTSDNTSLIIGAQLSYGEIFSEYWYYPTSFYLRGDWYF